MDLTISPDPGNVETGSVETGNVPTGNTENFGDDQNGAGGEDPASPGNAGSSGNPAGTAELHRYAQALLVHLAADGSAPALPPGVTDVPGYWLAPAIEALVLIMSGQDALEPLAHATQLDDRHTTLFLCLALAVCGQGDRIHASWLGTAFGELSADHPVTHGQRALWLAAARGAYGPVGKIFVLRKLDAVAVPTEDERWLAALSAPEALGGTAPAADSGAAEAEVPVPQSLQDFPELANVSEITKAIEAAALLRRLRERCAEITSAPQRSESEGGVEVTKVVSGMIWAEDEPLAVLRSLIGQGEPQGPLSSLTGHLLHDVQPDGDPHLAALAIYLAAPSVKAAAETLAKVVREPPPDTVTLSILGYPVKLRPEGPDQETLSAAEHRIVTECVPRRSHPGPAYLLVSVAVVATVAGLAVALSSALEVWSLGGWASLGWVIAGAGLGLGAWGGRLLWGRRAREQAEIEKVQKRARELSDLADKAVWVLHEYAREAEERADAADQDLVDLTRLLRRGPRAA
ncbi:hypothetical protein ACFHYQ_24760 [Sphaerimonospora cavernae]|uniref:Uncharacterized protein n=1 Tax=Sphaerimonospora cavernae TaxID=1740611 RepID=A0ABV6UBK1_9ACTN